MKQKELNYDVDNRDSNTTWLTIKDGEENLGHIEVTRAELIELIHNMDENSANS